MNRAALIVGLVVVVPLIVFLAISFRFDPRAIDSPLVGQPAPTFTLVDLDGEETSLEKLRGKPVLINFWATWCPPCVAEHPVLVRGARQYAGRVHFVGIVYQDEPGLIRRFVTTRGAWGPSLLDPDGKVAIAYGVFGAPETFLLDRDGTVVDKITGPVTPNWLVSSLEALL